MIPKPKDYKSMTPEERIGYRSALDDIIEELYFKLQVDAGLRELDDGKSIPHDKAKDRMSHYL